ncbi:InlB B-repeat-containing protein [Vagococcus sp.]|uniref:InlB B-repeat-containing protein n=1 Tax=Vagococcus sp. TaxID=1933889 RepID=UPI003F9CEC0B
MKKKLKLVFIFLVMLVSCVFYFTEQSEAISIKEHEKVTTLESRGSEELDVKHSYTPKFIVGETRVEAFNADGTIAEKSMIAKEFFVGEGIILKVSEGEVNKGTVVYYNMGTYEGKNVNIRLNMSSNSSNVMIGTDENTYLMTFGTPKTQKNKIDVSLEFFDDENKPLKISGNWTFSAVNAYKKLRFPNDFFIRGYVLKNTYITYESKGEQIELSGGKAGANDGDQSYITLTFSDKTGFDYSYESTELSTYAVRFDPNLLPSIPKIDLSVKGGKVLGQFREEKKSLFTYTQRIPYTNAVDYLNHYQLEIEVDPLIEILSEEDFIKGVNIIDDLGADRKSDFNISIDTNQKKLKISGKSEVLNQENFYDKIYRISLSGKTREEDYSKRVEVKSEGMVEYKRKKTGSPTQISHSNKAITTLEPSTVGELEFDLSRTKNKIQIDELTLKDKVNEKYELLDIRFPEKLKLNYDTAFLNDKKWFKIENETDEPGWKSLSFSMKADNKKATIEKFLKSIDWEADSKTEKNVAENIKISLEGEVYTERKDENEVTHYYKFVPKDIKMGADSYTWFDAYNDAKKMKFKGLTGYLATLTSAEEHDFVYDNIAKQSGFFGGSRMLLKDSKENKPIKIEDFPQISRKIEDYALDIEIADKWYWVAGPEAGKVFYNKPLYEKGYPGYDLEKGEEKVYNGFANPENLPNTGLIEPNNSSATVHGGETILEFAQSNSNKYWNDLPSISHSKNHLEGYYAEFSEYGGQKEEELGTSSDFTATDATAKIPKPVEYIYKSSTSEIKEKKIHPDKIKIGTNLTAPVAPNIKYYSHKTIDKPLIIVSDKKQEVTYTYTPIDYTLEYDANKGVGTIASQKFNAESQVSLNDNQSGFTREDYKFGSWNTKSDGKGTEHSPGVVLLGKDLLTSYSEIKDQKVTIYAKWLLNTKGQVKFAVERKGHELKLINLVLDQRINKKYSLMRLELPKDVTIDYGKEDINFPEGWFELNMSEEDGEHIQAISMESDNSLAKIKKFLEDIRFKSDSQSKAVDSGKIKIVLYQDVYTSFIIPNPSDKERPGTRHYYKFIKNEDINWKSIDKDNPKGHQPSLLETYNLAKKEKFRGMKGYLATLTSAEEHNFMYENIAKQSGWLGGTRIVTKEGQKIKNELSVSMDEKDYEVIDMTKANEWYWMSGPESGTVFFNKPVYDKSDPPLNGAVEGEYQGFRNPHNIASGSIEPNNTEGDENALEFASASGTRWWNDLSQDPKNIPGSYQYIKGFYVEFSEYEGGDKETAGDVDAESLHTEASADVPQAIYKQYQSTSAKVLSPEVIDEQMLKIGDTWQAPEKKVEHYETPVITPNSFKVKRDAAQLVTYQYTPKNYTLTYDGNGGNGTIAPQTFTIETPSLTLASGEAMTKKGYLPKRWQSTKTAGDTYTFGQKLTGEQLFKGNTTLYVGWEEHKVQVTLNYLLENSNQELVALKDVMDGKKEVKPVEKMYQVGTPIPSILTKETKDFDYYLPLKDKTKFKIGTAAETTTQPAELTEKGITVTFIYQGTLALEVPKVVSFKPTKLAVTPPKNIELTDSDHLKVINTQGAGGNWQVRAKLEKMMTRNNQKLLGEITYLPSANQTPIVFNETLKPIINNQTNQQIDTTIPLLETEKGLRLSLESGNLMGTYGEGIIKWELGDYPKIK